MSFGWRRIAIVGLLWAVAASTTRAQVTEIFYQGQEGQTSSDALSPLSWSPQQVPDSTNRVMLAGGGPFNKTLDIGANEVTWRQIFLTNNGPVNVNGTGKINLAIPYDDDGNGDPLGGPQQWAIFTAGGEAFGTLVGTPSVINPEVFTESFIETNGGHSLTFNGKVTAQTIQAYAGTKIIFNGNVTLTASASPDTRFLTGNETNPSITFNGAVELAPRDGFPASGFGVRNSMTVNLGPNATLSSNIDATGWGEVNLYNGSKLRLFGDNRLGAGNDVWSRGANSILTNTLDLNGHSDAVEFFGTAADSTLVIDYGSIASANSLAWDATHQMNGQYSIVNYQIGTDTLTLGAPGNGFWFETGDPASEEVQLAKIKINGFSYAPFNPATTTPYWSVSNPGTSRAVEFFNAPSANFDGINGVDGRDFLIWQRGFGLTGQTTNANGDATRDGKVDGADLAIFKQQFSTTAVVPVAGSVPEPAALSMMLVGLWGAGWAGRRRGAR